MLRVLSVNLLFLVLFLPSLQFCHNEGYLAGHYLAASSRNPAPFPVPHTQSPQLVSSLTAPDLSSLGSATPLRLRGRGASPLPTDSSHPLNASQPWAARDPHHEPSKAEGVIETEAGSAGGDQSGDAKGEDGKAALAEDPEEASLQLQALHRRKEDIEGLIETAKTRLAEMGAAAGEEGEFWETHQPLVDAEGFPRSDIPVMEVLQQRGELAKLKVELKEAEEQLESAISSFFSPPPPH